jgi:hypothetical protein
MPHLQGHLSSCFWPKSLLKGRVQRSACVDISIWFTVTDAGNSCVSLNARSLSLGLSEQQVSRSSLFIIIYHMMAQTAVL